MQTSGVLQVKETIDYQFGDNSGRHGITHTSITREPDTGANDDMDIVYGIDNFQVTSPGPASTPTYTDEQHRDRWRPESRDELPDRERKPDRLGA